MPLRLSHWGQGSFKKYLARRFTAGWSFLQAHRGNLLLSFPRKRESSFEFWLFEFV
jgi:hypothetical protein